MFTRPGLYHPYKPSTPKVSPAGFRIVDYINPRRCFNVFQGTDFANTRSPAPSPLTSPVKGLRHPDDDAPPTLRLAGLFPNDGLGTPMRPSAPNPYDHLSRVPKMNQPNVPAQDPLFNLPRRKDKYGPKHLSFNNGAIRSGNLPPHRRAQRMKEKRDKVRKKNLERHERRVARACEGLSDLRREAQALMTPEHMDDEDKIFLKQLENLEIDQEMDLELEQCRQQMSRAAAEATQRQREHEERDEEAAKMWGERQDEEALEEQKRMVAEFVQAEDDRRTARHRRMEEAALRADEEQRRVHEALERRLREEQDRIFRQHLARKAKEEERRQRQEREVRRRREERERQLREERLQEEQERKLREERERQLKEAHERFIREERERLAREDRERHRQAAHEQFVREERERLAREERERHARFLAEQARRAAQQDEQTHQQLVLYEGKWNELRTNNALPLIDVREMPWPVFGVVSSVDQVTYQDVRTFLFHPQRPGVEGKTARDKVKSEVLRFHPDKFNTRILSKIQPSQQAVAQAIAGAVARILTRIMTEEVE